LIIFIIN